MNTAAPDGAPPRRVITGRIFGKHGTAPPCPVRGPEAGVPHICNFHGSGVDSPSSCTFLQSAKTKKRLPFFFKNQASEKMDVTGKM